MMKHRHEDTSRAVLFLALVHLSILIPPSLTLDCPAQCRCPPDHNTTVDCSDSLLKSPPQLIPDEAETLDLSHNALGPIINATFPRLGELKDLDLSFNGLTRLLGCTLQGMLKLERLNLRGNRLTSVPESLFEDATYLEQLDLSHNLLRSVPDHVFRRVPHLKTLDLSHNLMVELKFGLAWQVPRYLTSIDLSNNHFEEVGLNSFYEARNWEPGFKRSLNLADCRMTSIEAASFKNIPGLNSLDLSRNPSLTVQNLTSVVKELETEGLERLSISGLNLTSLGPFFTQVTRMSLKFLNASDNKIEQIPTNTFTTISSLRVLDISGNKLSELGDGLSPLTQLKVLNLSSNALTSFKGGAVANLARLKVLDVSKNSLANPEDVTFGPLVNLKSLDVSENLMTEVVLPSTTLKLKRCDYHSNGITQFTGFNNAPKLEYFDMSDNDLEKVDKFLFKEAHLLKLVNFSKNSIASLDHQAFLPQSAIVIDLSQNFLTKVQYSHWIATQELYLNRNKINDLDIQAFYRMDGLRTLDISENEISYLHDDLFDFTNNLQYLNLSHNAIAEAYFFLLFRNLLNLEVLDLGYNNISHINKSMLLPLPRLQSFSIASNHLETIKPRVFRDLQHIKHIDLSGNPFLCDCDNLGFQDWLKRTRISITGLFSPNSSAYSCLGPDHRAGKHVTEWSPDQFECDRTMLYMIISGSVAMTLILAGIVTTIIYRVYKCYQRRKAMREKARLEDYYSNEDGRLGKHAKGGKLDLSRMTTEEIAEEITNAIERRERKSMRKAEEIARKKKNANHGNGYVPWPPTNGTGSKQKINGEASSDHHHHRGENKKEEKKHKEKDRKQSDRDRHEKQKHDSEKKEAKDKMNKKERENVENRRADGDRRRHPNTKEEEERALRVHRRMVPVPQWTRSGRGGGGGYPFVEAEHEYGYQTEPDSRRRSDPRYSPGRWGDAADVRDRDVRGWVVHGGHGPRRSRSQGRGHDDRYMTLPIREQDYHPFRERGRTSHRRGVEPRMYLDHYTNEVRFGVEDLQRYPPPPDHNNRPRAGRSGRWTSGPHQPRSRSLHHLPQDHGGSRRLYEVEAPTTANQRGGNHNGYRSDDDRRPLIGQRAVSQPYLNAENTSDWL